MSAVSVATTRLKFKGFRAPNRNKFAANMDMIIHPDALEETAWEIINTKGQVNSINNNANFHQGRYKMLGLTDLSDTKNWFGTDSYYMKKFNIWVDRTKVEFVLDKSSDTFIAKFCGYTRFERKWIDWRWIYGHNVN